MSRHGFPRASDVRTHYESGREDQFVRNVRRQQGKTRSCEIRGDADGSEMSIVSTYGERMNLQ